MRTDTDARARTRTHARTHSRTYTHTHTRAQLIFAEAQRVGYIGGGVTWIVSDTFLAPEVEANLTAEFGIERAQEMLKGVFQVRVAAACH